MNKELVVIDTNVFLSALKSNKGFSYKLVSEIGTEKFDIAISVPLVLEYESILKKFLDKNIFTDEDIDKFIGYICAVGKQKKIFFLWRPFLKDYFDDHVLEVAINSNCKTIITFNKKDFLKVQELGIQVLTPKEFLEKLENQN